MTTDHDHEAIVELYFELLRKWNAKNADGMAALMSAAGHMVGFDGTQLDGPAEVARSLGDIFEHHATASYVAKVRGVQMMGENGAMLRAIVGMVPRGHDDISPIVNAVQTLIAGREDGRWRIVLLQSTPAAFHGRPQLAEAFAAELREVLRVKGIPG